MRVNTELSERPPVYSVTNDNGTAYIRFYTDVQEEQRDDGFVFTAIMWEMSCPWAPNLERRIHNNEALWLAKVKSVTAQEDAAKRLEELKVTATDDAVCDLAEIVADLTDAVVELAGLIV